jgi:hypothetical protein
MPPIQSARPSVIRPFAYRCEVVDRKVRDFDGITAALADLDDRLRDNLSNRIGSIC